MDENWEGAGGQGEHRTVGPHRAWCYQCSEWCYPSALCPCCDQVHLPERWRGMNVGDVLEELHKQLAGLTTSRGDLDGLEYVRLDDVLDLLGE